MASDQRIERPVGLFDDPLLRLDHRRVLLLERKTAHLRDLLLQIAVELLVGRGHAETHSGEEIVGRALVLRRQQVDRMIAGAGVRRRAHLADAGHQPQRARRHPAHLGEFVDARRMVRPELRKHPGRCRIGGMPSHHHIIAVLLDGDLGFHGVGVTENALVQVGGVAEVEKIVDHQLVVGADDDAVALGGVEFRHVIEHAEVRHLVGIGRRVAHPDPDRLVLFEHRIAFDPGPRRNVLGAVRVVHAGAGAVELQAMIRALDAIAVNDFAHAQRREAVRTAVLDCRHAAVGLAIEHDRFGHDGAGHDLHSARLSDHAAVYQALRT